MSSSFFPQRRRAVVLLTLVVLLHWLVLGWLTAGTRGLPLPGNDGAVRITVAELLPALPRDAPPTEPAPPPEPAMVQPPLPEFAPPPTIAVAEEVVGEPVPPGPPVEASAPPAAPVPQLAASEPPPAQAPDPGTAPVVHTIRRYKVDVPPPADITYDVARVDADGTRWSGQALLSWKLDPQAGLAYQVRFEAGIKVVFARVNLVVLTSEGHIGNTGFAPVKMTEKRRGRALTATHFDWPANKVTFSASQNNYALLPGAQDKATVPLQLAAIARGDQGQLSGDIDMFVGEDRWGSVYTFKVVGPEDIDTPLGRLQTVRVARPPKQGSYKSRLDIWLAPAHGWVPVKILSSEANGAMTTQTVNKIAMNRPGF